MRKNTARHWLHAILDLLPVILIPVFMIYSHRHDMTQQTEVDIQYKYQSNEVNSNDDLIVGNVYHFSSTNITSSLECDFLCYILNGTFEVTINSDWVQTENTNFSFINNQLYDLYISQGSFSIYYYDAQQVENVFYFECENYTFDLDIYLYSILSLDTTDDYTLFANTTYNVIESVEVNDVTSSVMNVFMDNFNNAVDKYFNMGNVFNMTNVYNWFNTNIFGGNAPVVIYSVWNIVLYEFVMDLLFLLYGLFMWFIDMCKRLMEKPLDSIK